MRVGMLALVMIGLVGFGPALARDDAPELVSSKGPREPMAEREGFQLPPGFEIQLVASDPDIHKPMNIAFDDRGRLWVTETIEYPFPVKEGTKGRDTVKILADFGPDGRARSITTFAEGLNIPIGLIPMPGGREALVHSIPTVDRLTDKDGDGKADSRELAYQTFGARDTHGMTNAFTWGFDGEIYACHGFSNSSSVQGKDGQAVAMQSGNTYRFKPDGSHAEQFTHGQVNPFGLAFDPLGNLYSADCHSKPIYMLLRGAYYPSFGKPHDGLGFGPEMVSHDHGSTAISGVVYYAAEQFPAAYRDTAFIGNVVTNKINHDSITWHGSTPRGDLRPDFLSSDDPWFRPVDLKLGPDGAIYVADFYNKIIGHYEVPLTHPGRDRERGRIWRIIYRGADGKGPIPAMPDIAASDVAGLVAKLGDPNLTVRTMATNQLVVRGGAEVLESLRRVATAPANGFAKVHALWAMDRLGSLETTTLADAMIDADRPVRVHARKILGERPESGSPLVEFARTGLKDADAFVRRASAEALARHPNPANVRPLLDARHAAPGDDAQLVHAVRMALRDQFLTAANWPAIGDAAYAEADFRTLADVALGAPTPASARFVLEFAKKYPEPRPALIEHVHHVARHGDPATDAELADFAKSFHPDDLGLQAQMIKAIQTGDQERGIALNPATRSLASEVAGKLLADAKPASVTLGIGLVDSLKMGERREGLAAIMMAGSSADALRVAALNALAGLDPKATPDALAPVLVDPSAPLPVREAAAQAISKSNQESGRTKLVETLPTAPARLQGVIAAALAANRPGAEALLDSVAKGKVSARLLQDRPIRVFLDQSGVPDLGSKIAALTEGLPPADAALARMIDARAKQFGMKKGDASKGLAVFKQNCAACHQMGGEGGRVGPQLDGLAARGADRIMEDVLDPNRNIDQAFRTTVVALKDGRTASGLLLREEGETLVLADAQGKDVLIPKASIDDKKVSPISPMPADFATRIAEPDFFDLIAYLAAARPTGSK